MRPSSNAILTVCHGEKNCLAISPGFGTANTANSSRDCTCFCSFSVFCKGLRGEQSSSEMMLPFSVVFLFYKLALLFHWFFSLPRALLLFDLFSLFPCALDPPCMCIEHMVHFVKSISPSFCKHIRYFKQSKHLTGF